MAFRPDGLPMPRDFGWVKVKGRVMSTSFTPLCSFWISGTDSREHATGLSSRFRFKKRVRRSPMESLVGAYGPFWLSTHHAFRAMTRLCNSLISALHVFLR